MSAGAVLGPAVELRPIDFDSLFGDEQNEMIRSLIAGHYEKTQVFRVLLNGEDIGEVGKKKVCFGRCKTWASVINLNNGTSENTKFWRIHGEGASPEEAILDALATTKRHMRIALLEADERLEQLTGQAAIPLRAVKRNKLRFMVVCI